MHKMLFMIGLLLASSSSANVLTPVPMQTQFRQSHATVLARAQGNKMCEIGGEDRTCVVFDDVLFVSHRHNIPHASNIVVAMDNGIDEAKVDCCEAGQRYIMFIVRYRGNYYLYHGRWSIQKIEPLDSN
jgi:hypothetical protein